MKVTRQKAEQNRKEIVRTAARLFRERGVDGTSVADIFREVGLTHGALYVQFPGGKDELAVEALMQAFTDRREVWDGIASNLSQHEALDAIVGNYMSAEHRDSPGAGCPTPSMGAEAGRRDGALRSAYTHGVHELLDTLQLLAPGESESDRKRAAMRILATLTGAILISRAVDDSVLAEEILDAVALSFAVRR